MVRACFRYLIKDEVLVQYSWAGRSKKAFNVLKKLNAVVFVSVTNTFPKSNYTKYKYNKYVSQYIKQAKFRLPKVENEDRNEDESEDDSADETEVGNEFENEVENEDESEDESEEERQHEQLEDDNEHEDDEEDEDVDKSENEN